MYVSVFLRMYKNMYKNMKYICYNIVFIHTYVPDSPVAVDLSHSIIISTMLLSSILISLLLTAVTSTVYTPVVRLGTVMGLSSTMVIG